MLTMIALVLLGDPAATDYPKVVHKNGQVCIEALVDNKVEESCRAENSEYRAPVAPSGDAPLAMRSPRTPDFVPGYLENHRAEAKRNWALAFKVTTASALCSALVLTALAAVALGTNVPHAADGDLAGAGAALVLAGASALVAVAFDNAAADELTGAP
jgi:hypothetical protein